MLSGHFLTNGSQDTGHQAMNDRDQRRETNVRGPIIVWTEFSDSSKGRGAPKVKPNSLPGLRRQGIQVDHSNWWEGRRTRGERVAEREHSR